MGRFLGITVERGIPCRCLDGHLKEPYEMSMAWEPDRRFNFFFNRPAHLCAVTYMTEILLIVTLNNHNHSLIIIRHRSGLHIVRDFISRHCSGPHIFRDFIFRYNSHIFPFNVLIHFTFYGSISCHVYNNDKSKSFISSFEKLS